MISIGEWLIDLSFNNRAEIVDGEVKIIPIDEGDSD